MTGNRISIAVAGLCSLIGANAVAAEPLPSATHKVLPAALAVEAAQASIAACKAQGYNVTVTVVDRTGAPVVMIAGDNARYIAKEVTRRKAYTSALWRMSMSEFSKRYPTPSGFDPSDFDDEIAYGAGAVPINAGNDTIGAISAAGAPGGDKDEACAQAGLDKIRDRLN